MTMSIAKAAELCVERAEAHHTDFSDAQLRGVLNRIHFLPRESTNGRVFFTEEQFEVLFKTLCMMRYLKPKADDPCHTLELPYELEYELKRKSKI